MVTKQSAIPAKDSLPASGPSAELVVVGIGASAGGLEAARRLLDALPPASGKAFVLVQHLDPSHASLLVDLLATHTRMIVCEAVDGAEIERDHFYVIPPRTYLEVGEGRLHLSAPTMPHGARRPIDFLLSSIARDYGANAVGVILSGTGTDGTLGAKAIKASGGLVIAQEPTETGYDGMVRSAIASAAADHVLRIADIPAVLQDYVPGLAPAVGPGTVKSGPAHWLSSAVDLIRTKTAHDFSLYKPGTLQRRIERRMALAGLKLADTAAYMAILTSNPAELTLLATDLLINVTSFFRDKSVFALLATEIVPDLLHRAMPGEPIRIWVAGCSSGEEAYSLAIVFREAMAATAPDTRLQVFASDVDPEAIVAAREGFYPASIENDVSAERLSRYFLKEENGYRIVPDLRASIVFTVQDVLADPPFSRLDMVSCRNLLIYFGAQAQAKTIGFFQFALKQGGLLLLGTSETIGDGNASFEVVSKPARIYRHIGPTSRLPTNVVSPGQDASRPSVRATPGPPPSRAVSLGDLARQRVLEAFGPATILIDRKNACVFTLGAVGKHLSVPPGLPTQDLYAMTDPGLHPKLRQVLQRATDEATRVTVQAGRFERGGETWSLALSAEPVTSDADKLILLSFVEARIEMRKPATRHPEEDGNRVSDLEQDLEATRNELAEAIQNLQLSGEEQKAINEEALSVNEEYQSTTEELLASKEELQSVNEELTALNTQLQETLDKQRTTANDLQNVLFSTDVATLFLDTKLCIRFFTPSTRALFNVISSDVGRPLADLHARVIDDMFAADAAAVLANHVPSEREVLDDAGAWYIRRILPYRTHADGVEGVVVTFSDVTNRRRIADALVAAKRRAQQADEAKSRFLAAASHDLRQPLQTLALLLGLLAQNVQGEKATRLVARLDDTLGSMAAMLNTLLDINQIEAGVVSAEISQFPVAGLLAKLRDEFSIGAESQGLTFRIVASSLEIVSDAHLIEQMIRNIVSNALKYTKKGKILLGCRRTAGGVRIEIWDTGLGIPESEYQSIFEEYHQIGNATRERANGLGLGLAIVKRLADLLGHTVSVRSQLGMGSVFAIDIPDPVGGRRPNGSTPKPAALAAIATPEPQTGTILVIEDGPDIRMLLEALLTADGYRVETAGDGVEALDMITRMTVRPDLILADFNRPNGMNGLQIATRVRHLLRRQLPVVILSGDISASTLAEIAAQGCVQMAKPVKLGEMRKVVQQQLTLGREIRSTPTKPVLVPPPGPVVFLVDDDNDLRTSLRDLLEAEGRTVEDFPTCEAFLAAFQPGREGCLLLDASLPGMSGLGLLRHLKSEGHALPAVMITGNGDVGVAVAAMKAGATDFVEKPVAGKALIACVDRALALAHDNQQLSAWREAAAARLASLTPRQHQIMDMILAGHPNKNIAADLGISQRTVENHRAAIMTRTGTASLPDLARMVVAAGADAGQESRPPQK